MSFEADRMQFLSIPTLWKSAFAWVLLGALAIGHAQTPDQGSLVLAGTITKTTCVLNFGDAQSTLAGRKTLSFGSIPTSQIPQGLGQGFENVAPKQTVILSVTNADGSPPGDATLNLGVRYVTARITGAQVASLINLWPGTDDVMPGNVSVLLPFVLNHN